MDVPDAISVDTSVFVAAAHSHIAHMSKLSLQGALLVSVSIFAASCASVHPNEALLRDRNVDSQRFFAAASSDASVEVSGLELASESGASAGSSSYVAPRRPPKDPWEVTLNGVGANNQDFSAGGTQLAGSVGYYLNKTLQINVRQQISQFDPGRGQSDLWNGATRVALDLHIPTKHVVPFVGVAAGVIYGDTTNETLIVGPEAGIKVYVKPDVFFQAMMEYQFFVDQTEAVGDAFDEGSFFYSFGFGVRF